MLMTILMKLVNILGKILQLIPILCAVLAVVWILINKEKNLLNVIKRNFRRMGKYVAFLLPAVVLFGGATTAVALLKSDQKAQMVVGLNYLEASSGLNPNKTKFTASSLLADPIMERVIEEGDYSKLDVETLKSGFDVEPLKTSEQVSLEQPYIPTEYSVTFWADGKTASLDPAEVLKLYGDALAEYFSETYSRKTNVLELDFSDLEQADYMDIGTILDSMATGLQRYMSACSQENGTFVSSETGESFRTLNQKILNYKSIAIENYQAFVLKKGVSKNKGQYIGKMNYNNRILDMDYRKNLAAYRTYLEVIDMYERDMATIVLVPTRDLDGEFYMSRTKIGVDNFSNGAETAASNAATLSQNISNNNYKITRLEANMDSSGGAAEAEAMIETLKTDLTDLAELAVKTVREYDEQSADGYITATYPGKGDTIKASVKTAAKSTLIFLGILIVLFLLKPEKASRRARA